MNERIEKVFLNLSKSKFRSHFHLKEKDKIYILEKGIKVIENHANDFVTNRISPKKILNDGKQTPMKGHPVFIAQHATATCCRNCIYKWHNIPKNVELNDEQIKYIVDVIMKWIKNELK